MTGDAQTRPILLVEDNPTDLDLTRRAFARLKLTNPIEFLTAGFRGKSIWRYVQTHPDMDHMRGISVLDRQFTINNIWDDTRQSGFGEPKTYVQDRMRATADEVSIFLKHDRTHIYICGLKGMESGVDEAMADICRSSGLDWAALRSDMRAQGRYHVETY